LPAAKWLTSTDKLLALVLDETPWEQKVMNYTVALSGGAADQEVVEESTEERILKRCQYELDRPYIPWFPITMDTIKEGHAKRSPGIFYGLEFPWNEAMLAEFGHKWLTQAMHTAGTLPKNNWVTKLTIEQNIKVTGGNNGGKFFFEVRYAKKSSDLHTPCLQKCRLS